MQSAETVLGVLRRRGAKGQPLERVYRLLFNRDLYLLAYGRIAKNRGALTPGVTGETADGMSVAKIDAIIEALRFERYRWTPVRRVHIPKKNGKRRPLGIPTWSDKLVQEVIRLILEAYYEPQFSDLSHGFRPDRGCHTALQTVKHQWTGTTWFIECDLSQFFDSSDQGVLLSILAERIHDGRFLALIGGLLKAGYLENWTYGATLSGTPQGGIVSPILSNIYLDRLDKWVETTLLHDHNRGEQRGRNSAYMALLRRAYECKRRGDLATAAHLRKEAKALPAMDTRDPEYRRLRYIRYADDILVGFTGPRSEAEVIKAAIDAFLREHLHLALSEDKTVITHARSEAARFLGYEVSVLHNDTARTTGDRAINGKVGLRVPVRVIQDKCAAYEFHGKPIHRPERLQDCVLSNLSRYQTEYRGLVEFYRLAYNLHRLNRVRWVMEQSLVETIARKMKLSVAKVYARYQTTITTPEGTYKVLRTEVQRERRRPLVGQWGGISLKHKSRVTALNDQPPRVWNNERTDLETRLLADTCELCSSQMKVEVHHIRALRDLRTRGRAPKPEWVRYMAARRRKTLVVCRMCHEDIAFGRPLRRIHAE